jgi:hypothetical protein
MEQKRKLKKKSTFQSNQSISNSSLPASSILNQSITTTNSSSKSQQQQLQQQKFLQTPIQAYQQQQNHLLTGSQTNPVTKPRSRTEIYTPPSNGASGSHTATPITFNSSVFSASQNESPTKMNSKAAVVAVANASHNVQKLTINDSPSKAASSSAAVSASTVVASPSPAGTGSSSSSSGVNQPASTSLSRQRKYFLITFL